MSIKLLKYGKRLGVILAGAVIGTTFGMSSFAFGAEELSRGFARAGIKRAAPGIKRAAPGIKRAAPAIKRAAPAINRVAFNRQAAPIVKQLPGRPIVAQRAFVRDAVIQNVDDDVNLKVVDPCELNDAAILGLVNDACLLVINNDDD